MSSPPLAALPAGVMDCIARMTLVAEDNDMQAWVRLSLVCRAWRESLRGAEPQLHV